MTNITKRHLRIEHTQKNKIRHRSTSTKTMPHDNEPRQKKRHGNCGTTPPHCHTEADRKPDKTNSVQNNRNSTHCSHIVVARQEKSNLECEPVTLGVNADWDLRLLKAIRTESQESFNLPTATHLAGHGGSSSPRVSK